MKNETSLSPEVLKQLDFKLKEKGFLDMEMHHYVRSGMFLFYNTPIQEGLESSYYIGHGEMRKGEYHLTCFRWINTVGQLKDIYESVNGTELKLPV